MNRKINQSGYILPLTLALISLFMFLATYVSNKGLIFGSFSKTMVEREKARQLAFGGIQLAMSQVGILEKKESMEKPAAAVPGAQAGKQPEQSSEGKQLLKAILPVINRPQSFALKQAVDGINGTITIVLGSEEGKININKLYDFDKHKFLNEGKPEGDMKKMLQELFVLIKDQTGADLFPEFEKFLKERKYPLNDVTELLTIKGFDVFKDQIFADPTFASDKKNPKIYLTDIFTVSSSKPGIEPWLFSNAIAQLFKLKRDPEKSPDDALKNFKDKNDWKNDWAKSLKLLWSADYGALPKTIAPLLNPSFDPKIFNVLSVGTVGKVSVRVLAFFEREKSSGKDGAVNVKIRNVYTL